MTVCAIEGVVGDVSTGGGAITITVDGMYAARLAGEGEALYAERWTLDGPAPGAVPLPLGQPEERGTDVLPLCDGRVLIRRRVAGRHLFSLVHPTGRGTAELPLGGVEAGELILLPPAPGGARAYAVAPGERSSAVWLVAGGSFGPEHVAEVPGRCSGGVWLDRTGRLLALDRRLGDGPVKAVAVDLRRGGEVTPLLQITEESDDRLLLAAPDSGLLLIRSNAPGHERLGWGVLGSSRPVRFPESLRLPDCAVRPFAVQSGPALPPEDCGVALRIDGATGSRVGVWRPAGRRLHQLVAPQGWLTGAGLWGGDGELCLPYARGARGCGVARVRVPEATAARALPRALPQALPGTVPKAIPGAGPKAIPGTVPKVIPGTVPEAISEAAIPERAPEEGEEGSEAVPGKVSDGASSRSVVPGGVLGGVPEAAWRALAPAGAPESGAWESGTPAGVAGSGARAPERRLLSGVPEQSVGGASAGAPQRAPQAASGAVPEGSEQVVAGVLAGARAEASAPAVTVVCRPIPLQQAPLMGRKGFG